ncbi:MAG: hypothetical protein ABW184_06275 [Sphingobium sp.]
MICLVPVIEEFSLAEGGPVPVTLVNIDYFKPSEEGTIIVLADGIEVVVTQSYDAVAEVFNPERQARP